MDPTPEQCDILAAGTTSDANLLINAFAGCGKTSTIEMVERAIDTRPILYLVFNKKNAEEAEERMLSTTTVRTFNSLGHRIWSKAQSTKKIVVNPRKSQDILREIINSVPKREQNELWNSYWDVIHGVALAKAIGYIPSRHANHSASLCSQAAFHRQLDESPDDLTSDLIDTVLTKSITQAYAGHIDYNDQVYMPALFGGTFPRFPLVLVDEVQDLNPVNHALLAKLARIRLMAVGDDAQSIYAFRGAMPGSMASIAETYSAKKLTLSTSFRCPSEIVKHVHWRVPSFRWTREGGTVNIPVDLQARDFADGSTIISRNNAPLFRCAMHLLAAGRSVQVAGSDIGPKLIGIMRKLGDEAMPAASVLSAIEDWRAERKAKESKTADDLADCMKVFAKFGSSLATAITYAEHLFAQKGKIRLMTGHKAKGLEFETVYHLDPWLCGFDQQDQNLLYVISTRSQNNLIEIDSARIKW